MRRPEPVADVSIVSTILAQIEASDPELARILAEWPRPIEISQRVRGEHGMRMRQGPCTISITLLEAADTYTVGVIWPNGAEQFDEGVTCENLATVVRYWLDKVIGSRS